MSTRYTPLLQTHGAKKYPASRLLGSSSGLGWSAISAELRSHEVGETIQVLPLETEICLIISGNDKGLSIRSGAGQCHYIVPRTGTICLIPTDICDDQVTITAPIPQILHLYLSSTLFDRLKDDFKVPASPAYSIRYLAGIRDSIIQQLGYSFVAELNQESVAGRMYIETASLTLAARLLQKYSDCDACTPVDTSSHHLDNRRLRRVLDHIAANIDAEITLADLAGVAGYSPFHFARKFTLAMGMPPHRYICGLRLENAMAALAAGKLSLAEIALNAHFSSQASFTRSFHRATGMTPKEYQRCRR